MLPNESVVRAYVARILTMRARIGMKADLGVAGWTVTHLRWTHDWQSAELHYDNALSTVPAN